MCLLFAGLGEALFGDVGFGARLVEGLAGDEVLA
jgi:Ni,Fe-hydrogenase maturation factor